MRVALITTGQMELAALAAALQNLFPAHQFEALHRIPHQPFHGFTSTRVQPLASHDPPGGAVELLRAALGALVPETATSIPADHVLILEDLELVNTGNEAVVVEHLRSCARRLLAELRPPADPAHVTALLRSGVSFHLAAPMPEAWFFGDLDALTRELDALTQQLDPLRAPPKLQAGVDPERFLTDDPDYAADDGSACANATLGSKPRRAAWLGPRREEHPKHYLAWLLRDPSAAACHRYKETQEGARLLGALRWSIVLADPANFTFLRALVRDLEDVLGAASAAPVGGTEAPLTSASCMPPDPVLRNV
jgi:hypothetical protein